MNDPRLDRLAAVLFGHSLRLQKDNIVQIKADMAAKPLVKALYKRAAELGLYLLINWLDDEITRLNYDLLTPDSKSTADFLSLNYAWEKQRWQDITAYLTIRAAHNDRELSSVDPLMLKQAAQAGNEVSDLVINQRQWALFYWPTAAQAQKAAYNTEAWFDHVFSVCLLDYDRLYQAEKLLQERMQTADQVQILAPGTDLRFSIKDIPAVCCYGRRNIPDGEVYTAPVRDSVNGYITYNVPSTQWGHQFTQIKLEFAKGKIIKSNCQEDEQLLQEILTSDPGASYIGEFSFGLNPLLRQPMGDTLFDEKITGSIHFTPGRAYAKADNGNRSALHWDLIQIQRSDYGGGAIYFDHELISQDGLFKPPYLQALNPENILNAD